METAVFFGKYNYKILKDDARHLSVLPMETAVSYPFHTFRDPTMVYLFRRCMEEHIEHISNMLIFSKVIRSTMLFLFESPVENINPLLELKVPILMTKQPRKFLQSIDKSLKTSLFAGDKIIRYDTMTNTIEELLV